jgi:hypothetical protein
MAQVKIDSSYVTINEDGTVSIDARAFEDEDCETKKKGKKGKKKDKKGKKKSLARRIGLPIALVGGGVAGGALIMALASNGKDDDYPALPDNERGGDTAF